jgi:hypothetical protein
MADEIQITRKLVYKGKETVDGGALGFTIPEKTYTFDQTGKEYTRSMQSIGTSAAEAIAVSAEIGTQGWCYIRNANLNTGVVYIGGSGQTRSSMSIKLEPGDPPAEFRAGQALYAQANTAAVSIEFLVLEK